MGLKKWYEKKSWKKELKKARRDDNQFIGNDSEANNERSQIYVREATALVNLGRLDRNPEYIADAIEAWEAAAETSDKSSLYKGRVANMYREFGEDARKVYKKMTGKDYGRTFAQDRISKEAKKEKENGVNHPGMDDFDPNKPFFSGYLMSEEAWAKYLEKHPELRGRKNPTRGGGLEGAFAIVGILGGIFFLSSNITGNAIANISQNSGNILGTVLLMVGFVAGFFWVKKKN